MAPSDLDEETSRNVSDEAAHLAGIVMPEMPEDEADEYGPQPVGEDGLPLPPEPDKLTQDQFWDTFQLIFSLPGTFLPEFAPLAIQPAEVVPARGASDACYRLIELWYPSILRPGSETLLLLLQAAPFLIAKVMVVRMILRNRDKAPGMGHNGGPSMQPDEGGGAAFRSTRGPGPRPEGYQPPAEGTGPLIHFNGMPEGPGDGG